MKTASETVPHAICRHTEPDIWGGVPQILVSYKIGGADLIESSPRRNISLCYVLLGKDRSYMGESGKGEDRFASTLRKNPWATLFVWLDMRQLGIHHNHARKHLEALLIFNISNSCKSLGRDAHITNVKFTRSLGRFSKEKSSPYAQTDKLISTIIKCIRSYKDPHGKYDEDNTTGHKVQSSARKHMSGYGPRSPLKFRSFELRLPTSTE
jgi:hypothetical protein